MFGIEVGVGCPDTLNLTQQLRYAVVAYELAIRYKTELTAEIQRHQCSV